MFPGIKFGGSLGDRGEQDNLYNEKQREYRGAILPNSFFDSKDHLMNTSIPNFIIHSLTPPLSLENSEK